MPLGVGMGWEAWPQACGAGPRLSLSVANSNRVWQQKAGHEACPACPVPLARAVRAAGAQVGEALCRPGSSRAVPGGDALEAGQRGCGQSSVRPLL